MGAERARRRLAAGSRRRHRLGAPLRLAGLVGLLAMAAGATSGLVGTTVGGATASSLPAAPVWTSNYTPHRPTSCSTPTTVTTTSKPTPGQPSSTTGSVPWPSAPTGTNPTHYATYLHTATTSPPIRPSNWSRTGSTWKLTSARSNPSTDKTLAKNPQELCGVEGNSVDTAWQTTTGRPTTLLAITDSGIEWCDPGIVDKVYVNTGAVPPPENATGDTKTVLIGDGTTFTDTNPYDLDDSGVVNAAQYTTDPRIAAVAADYGGLFCSVRRGGFGPTAGLVSPMDLIRTFGTATLPNGTPNPYYYAKQSPTGFTEAISGWNFLDNDNNAYDDIHYDHGTGEAEDSSGAANNLSSEVGACPNCMILPIRVGDSFITSGNEFAQAVLFAVDSGATVVQEALGTTNITESDRQAIKYATDHGVPVVASAADEESDHHNLPSALPTTIVVNSVTKDTSAKPPSYLYLNGCTNYGANISVSVESASCSSEATGKSSGIVGLAESEAQNAVQAGTIQDYPGLTNINGAPVPLSANEIAQLVTMSASSVDFGTAAPPYGKADNYTITTGPLSTNPLTKALLKNTRYPSHAGYNQYFGYGRINATAIVTWISHGEIPPEASITSPTWFDLESTSGQLPVTGTIGTPSSYATGWRYQVDVGLGATPLPGTWKLVATGTGTGVKTGTLADITLAQVAALFPKGTNFSGGPVTTSGTADQDKYTFSIQVVVQATSGKTNGMVGMARRADFVHGTQGTLAGFPQKFTSSLDASPTLAPIGPNGTNVLLIPTAGGSIEALEANGTELPGFPVYTNPLPAHVGEKAFSSGAVTAVPRGELLGGVAVGDLAHAGGPTLDIVSCDMTGRCYAWNAKGHLLPGFPVRTDPTYSLPTALNTYNTMLPGIASSPALGDLTGNGTLDIVAGSLDRHVYAWKPTGKSVPGWPVLAVDPSKVTSVNAKTDEITFKSTVRVAQGTAIFDTPAIGNLTGGSGPPDVVVGSDEEYTGPINAHLTTVLSQFAGTLKAANASVFAIYPDGADHVDPSLPDEPVGTDGQAFLPGWPASVADLDPGLLPLVGDGVTASPTLADVSGDGKLDVGVVSVAGPAYVLKPTGTSALGTTTGKPTVMTATTPGAHSNSTGLLNTSLPALGGPVFATLGATAPGVSLVAPAGSLGELANEEYPANQSPHENQVDAWDATTGAFDAGFPQQMNDLQFLATPIVADVGGSSTPYVVEGSGAYDIRAVDTKGQEAPGFPKFTGGWMVNSPEYGSFGNLGTKVLAVGTREGYLFVWKTTTSACAASGPWPKNHHDLYNTGNLDSGAPTTGACAPAKVVFTTSPGASTAGSDLSPQPAVAIEAADGRVVTSDSSTVTLSVATGTPTSGGPGRLTGCVGHETKGVVTFTGCSMGAAGTGYKLRATDGSLTPAVSGSFDVASAGYDLVGSDGGVFVFPVGQAGGFFGSLPGLTPPVSVNNIVGIVPTNNYNGYDLVGSDGGVFVFPVGQPSGFFGSLPGLTPPVSVNNIVGIVPTNNYNGYDLVGSDGGVFVFPVGQTSGFYGSLPGDGINVDNIVGIAATGDDKGYWLAGSTGHVYSLGDAAKVASPSVSAPVVGIAADATSAGGWLVADDGSVYPFGDATSFGTLPALGVGVSDVVSIVPTPSGKGYWLIGADGTVFPFGEATTQGTLPTLGVGVSNIVGAVPTG